LVQPNLGAAVDDRDETSMTEQCSPFHDGEQMAQTKVGVRDQIERRGRAVIRSFMPDQHREFFASQPFLVASSADREGQPWASMLFGAPGFMTSDEPDLLKVEAWPASDDPLLYGLHNGASVGGLGIELPSRRRNRVNGRIEECRNGIGFTLRVQQSFGNCHKYIQARAPQPKLNPDPRRATQSNVHLVKTDIDLIAAADTFFIASRSASLADSKPNGLDVSHRGGLPGFVQVVSDHELCFPDYKGNLLFNTLGNLLADPRAGLLFVDFRDGTILQLSGRARVVWDVPEAMARSGAERQIFFNLDCVMRRENACPFAFDFLGYSPHLNEAKANPPSSNRK
jgi:predicted pyridoxine 5'-phosphate oxidase superfamily flavin-nucleotide-binding protein